MSATPRPLSVQEWLDPMRRAACFDAMLAALKDADEYLTYVEGKGEGGTSRFDVAAQSVRAALRAAEGAEQPTEG